MASARAVGWEKSATDRVFLLVNGMKY